MEALVVLLLLTKLLDDAIQFVFQEKIIPAEESQNRQK